MGIISKNIKTLLYTFSHIHLFRNVRNFIIIRINWIIIREISDKRLIRFIQSHMAIDNNESFHY